MSSHSQLQAVQQSIHRASAQIDKAEGELSNARTDNDSKELDFLCKRLQQLDRQLSSPREQQTTLLQGQVSTACPTTAWPTYLYTVCLCHVGPTPCWILTALQLASSAASLHNLSAFLSICCLHLVHIHLASMLIRHPSMANRDLQSCLPEVQCFCASLYMSLLGHQLQCSLIGLPT